MLDAILTDEQKKLRDEMRDFVKSVPRQLILDNVARAFAAGLDLKANVVYIPGLVDLDSSVKPDKPVIALDIAATALATAGVDAPTDKPLTEEYFTEVLLRGAEKTQS